MDHYAVIHNFTFWVVVSKPQEAQDISVFFPNKKAREPLLNVNICGNRLLPEPQKKPKHPLKVSTRNKHNPDFPQLLWVLDPKNWKVPFFFLSFRDDAKSAWWLSKIPCMNFIKSSFMLGFFWKLRCSDISLWYAWCPLLGSSFLGFQNGNGAPELPLSSLTNPLSISRKKDRSLMEDASWLLLSDLWKVAPPMWLSCFTRLHDHGRKLFCLKLWLMSSLTLMRLSQAANTWNDHFPCVHILWDECSTQADVGTNDPP